MTSLIIGLSAIWGSITEDCGLQTIALRRPSIRGPLGGPLARALPDRAALVAAPQISGVPRHLETGEQLGVGRHAAEARQSAAVRFVAGRELCPLAGKLDTRLPLLPHAGVEGS